MGTSYTREALYDLVWSEPLRNLAKQFDISDVRLGKICREAGIPLPGVGYWAKKQAGKHCVKPALPARELGESGCVYINDLRRSRSVERERLDEPEPIPPEFTETYELVLARAQKIAEKAPIRKTLSNPHPLISKLLEADRKKKEDQDRYPYPLSSDWRLFASPFESRRLRILNSLFLALARCGCRVDLKGHLAREIAVKVGDQGLVLELDSAKSTSNALRKSPQLFGRKEQLRLTIAWDLPLENITYQWIDTDILPLEEQVREMVIGILVAGEYGYRALRMDSYRRDLEWREYMRKQRLEREEAERKREQERIEKIARDRRNKLLTDAAAWRTATNIRAYVASVLEKHRADGVPAGALVAAQAWADWAVSEADSLDPLLRLADAIQHPPDI